MIKFLRLQDVMSLTGLGRSVIYAKMAAGEFPKSVLAGKRRIVWVSTEIEEWQKSIIAARDARLPGVAR